MRARFAPSPTGSLHLGNARTAIFNYLLARAMGGALVLRVEDTDRERSDSRYETEQLETLEWLGVVFDESPAAGGPRGPYRQSQRLELYARVLEELSGRAEVYPCYCTDEELAAARKQMLAKGQPPRYPGTCYRLSPARRRELEAAGRRPAMRLHVPGGRSVHFVDAVFGPQTFNTSLIGDFVLMKADGTPTYNFAAAVDDHYMGITHVLRGADHLPNTPRQLIIYELMGWQPPVFAHHGLLVGPDGKKLSKRHGPVRVEAYRAAGVLPEALANYLGWLGGGVGSEGRAMDLEEMAQLFELTRLSRSPVVFDPARLRWLGGAHMRRLEPLELLRRLEQERGMNFEGLSRARAEELGRICQENAHDLAEAEAVARMILEGPASPPALEGPQRELLAMAAASLPPHGFANEQEAGTWIKALGKTSGLKGKNLYMPLRLALTGSRKGPELVRILTVLEREELARRLDAAARG